MPKPQSWQLNPANYPFKHRTETRFADLDLLGHINNVSMAGLFEHGRGMFNHAIEGERRAPGQRWLIVSVAIEYIAEAHFPEHVEIASGILRIGKAVGILPLRRFKAVNAKLPASPPLSSLM